MKKRTVVGIEPRRAEPGENGRWCIAKAGCFQRERDRLDEGARFGFRGNTIDTNAVDAIDGRIEQRMRALRQAKFRAQGSRNVAKS